MVLCEAKTGNGDAQSSSNKNLQGPLQPQLVRDKWISAMISDSVKSYLAEGEKDASPVERSRTDGPTEFRGERGQGRVVF